MFCTCMRSCARANDAKSCAVGMRNALLRNHLNEANWGLDINNDIDDDGDG